MDESIHRARPTPGRRQADAADGQADAGPSRVTARHEQSGAGFGRVASSGGYRASGRAGRARSPATDLCRHRACPAPCQHTDRQQASESHGFARC